jgi:hypothetical protein
LSPRTRTLRYGASIAVALVGVACGATIPGTAGGTAATVLVGIGLVGIVSLIFYEVGLTEDRDRASGAGRDGAVDEGRDGVVEGSRRASDAEHDDSEPPRPAGTPGEHDGGRIRPLERRRGQRRRLR